MKISRREIQRRYNKLIKNIEKEGIYDGRNTYDEYVCEKCGAKMYTTYKDKGVTPFIMPCSHCGGAMMHYNTYHVKPDADVKQWVRPTLEQVFKLHDRDMIEHVLKGGLILEEDLKK